MQSIVNSIITNPLLYRRLRYKPATLYYLRLEFPSTSTVGKATDNAGSMAKSPLVLYKLGYTTTSLQERVHGKPATYYYNRQHKRQRVAGHNGMGLPSGTNVYVISTVTHRNASEVYQWEQYLHNKYRSHRYCGQSVMGNGNTELYTRDILELDC